MPRALWTMKFVERLKEANRRKSLGPKTGPKVLTGQSGGGTGEEITAVLWASDLRALSVPTVSPGPW